MVENKEKEFNHRTIEDLEGKLFFYQSKNENDFS